MLTSTYRRILNIVCLSLAFVALGAGLFMKYSKPTKILQSQLKDNTFELVVDRDTLIERDYFVGEPD